MQREHTDLSAVAITFAWIPIFALALNYTKYCCW